MKLNRIPAVKDNLLQVDVILVASTAKSAVSIKEKLAQNHDKFDFRRFDVILHRLENS